MKIKLRKSSPIWHSQNIHPAKICTYGMRHKNIFCLVFWIFQILRHVYLLNYSFLELHCIMKNGHLKVFSPTFHFHQHLNSKHPGIQFTMGEGNDCKLAFLDVLVTKKCTHYICLPETNPHREVHPFQLTPPPGDHHWCAERHEGPSALNL